MKRTFLLSAVLAAAFMILFAVCAFAGVVITPEELKTLPRVTEYAFCEAIGDADLSGHVEPSDARLILRATVRLEQLTAKQLILCDTNGDQHVNAEDARNALRFSVGLDSDRRPSHYTETVVVAEPTCAEEGYTVRYCLLCEKIFSEQKTPKTDHVAGVWEVTAPATCKDNGVTECKCIYCGQTLMTDILPKGEHVYGDWIYPDGKSCVKSVKRFRECTVCGARQNEVVPAVGAHQYEWVVTREATCTEDGERTYMCVNCDNRIRSEVIPATGHDAPDWTVTKKATCTEDGVREKICLNCGQSLEKETVAAPGHDFNNVYYKELAAPTCQQEGRAQGICSVCGESHEFTLPKTAHKYTKAPVTVKRATCTEDGLIEAECAWCGEIKEVVPATGHTLTWHIAKEATCTEQGEQVSVCSVCGATVERQPIPKAAHSYGGTTTMIQEPTCSKAGSCYVTCRVCGDKLVRELPATGIHVAGDETVTVKEATCTDDRRFEYKCKYCGAVMPETERAENGTALGHDFPGWTTLSAPSCTVPGKKQSVCARCGAEAILDIEPLGHRSTGKWEIAEQPTCAKEGLEVIRCKFCGDVVEKRAIAKKAHTLTTRVVAVATCQSEGCEIVECAVCGTVIDTVVKPKKEHVPVYKVTKEATCAAEGEETITCDVCKQKIGVNVIPKKDHTPETVIVMAPTCVDTGLSVVQCSVCGEVLGEEFETPKGDHNFVPGAVTEPAALSTFRWDAGKKQGTIYGWRANRCAVCGLQKDNEKYNRVSVSGNWEPVFDARTNLTQGRIMFRFKDAAAYNSVTKVVYTCGDNPTTVEVKPADGLYSFTVPAGTAVTDTIYIFVISQ